MACGYWLAHSLKQRARAVSDWGETGGVGFYRAELERVRDYHRGMRWRWLILPPPFILFDLGFAQLFPRMARKYQEQIDALDASTRSAQ